ncbi:MAG: insulinase family protein [Alphaproteobacteria bacterium]|nr:insulinase family protein [Alphaproteobacteria bacterium]
MKKIVLLGVGICFIALGIWGIVRKDKINFDANKILENSILKEKEFSPNVNTVYSSDKKVQAYHLKDDSVGLVFVNFGFDRMGSAYEPKEGVGVLAESSLLDGAGVWKREELRKLMKEKGIKIGLNVQMDSFDFAFSYVKEFEDEAWEVLKAVIYDAHLEEDNLALSKKQLKMLRMREEEKPENKLSKLILKEFYGNHPYGKEIYPKDDKLDDLDKEDIREYLKYFMAKDVLSIGIAGNIEEKRVSEFLDFIFDGLEDKTKADKLLEHQFNFDEEKKTVELDFSKQSFAKYIGKGIKRSDVDFYPFYVADYIFGGSGLNSRLSKVIREKEGLTYGIYSYMSDRDAGSFWNIYYSATPENAERIEEIIGKEYDEFLKNGVSEEEVLMAKKNLLSSFNLRFAKLSGISLQLQYMKRQNLGVDFLKKRQGYVKAVKRDDVNRVIKEKMPKNMRIFVGRGK